MINQLFGCNDKLTFEYKRYIINSVNLFNDVNYISISFYPEAI